VFFFDRDGKAREVMTTTSDERGIAGDISRMVNGG
jgi:hypothetical protein